MKKVVLMITAAVFTTVLFSCKNENPTEPISISSEMETPTNNNEETLAMVTSENFNDNDSTKYLYVTASSGLTLREFGNLHSEKLARMPYGTKVKVVHAQKMPTMNVGGIKGGMDEITFNHKKGFAFNGYLSRYFPPEADISVKGYANELKAIYPEVIYTETSGGTVSKPINTEAITLPNAQWHEAFFTAQRLFDFPKEFTFPNPKGKNTETIFDGKPKKGIWVSELQISRKDNELQKIKYVYSAAKFDANVTIEKVDGVMKLSKIETIK